MNERCDVNIKIRANCLFVTFLGGKLCVLMYEFLGHFCTF